MRTKMLMATLVGLLCSISVNVPASYAVTNLTADVFGVSKTSDSDCSTAQNSCEITLGTYATPGTYNGFTIAGTDATHPAKIVASDDVADSIRLEFAVITGPAGVSPCTYTASGLLNCPTISFTAMFSSPPDNTGGQVQFVRQISGTSARGAYAATQSALRIEGWVEGIAVDSPSNYGYWKVTCSTLATCGILDPPNIQDRTQTWQTGAGLPNARAVTVQVWLYSRFANDKFTINYAKVKNPGGAADGKSDCVVYPPNKGKGAKNRCSQ